MSNQESLSTRAQLYSLKVTLNGIMPPIWRRVICPVDASLELLSVVIQEAFGWAGAHPYKFKIRNEDYYCDAELFDDQASYPESKSGSAAEVTLVELNLKKGDQFEYHYDFGDDWRHTITLEEQRDARVLEPEFACRAGERAAPLEDCGGIPGYQEILAAKLDERHPRREEFDEIYDLDSFDPNQFDVTNANERIQIELLLDDEMRDFIYQISESDSEDQFAENDDTLEDADKDTRIELLLSIAFTNQLMADEPKEVLLTIEQLTRLGVVEEDAFTRVFEVFSEEFFESHIGERAFDLSRYLKNLSKLSAEVESEK
jgi:hypothetical protein